MRYVYTAGPYTEFRGYVFVNGKPTTIRDKGTLEALAKRTDFSLYVEPVAEPRRKILTVAKKKAAA
jgi:hypothetical protein